MKKGRPSAEFIDSTVLHIADETRSTGQSLCQPSKNKSAYILDVSTFCPNQTHTKIRYRTVVLYTAVCFRLFYYFACYLFESVTNCGLSVEFSSVCLAYASVTREGFVLSRLRAIIVSTLGRIICDRTSPKIIMIQSK